MSNESLNYQAVKLRRCFGICENTTIDFDSIIYSQEEITLLSFPMRDNLYAICAKDDSNKIVAVNSANVLGRQRFSLAHELYHLYVQNEFQFSICTNDTRPKAEREADTFATFFLMPQQALFWFIEKKLGKNLEKKIILDIEDVIKLEQYFKISHSAMLIRLKNESLISEKESEEFRENGIIQTVRSLGYNDSLYKPTNINQTYGKYIKIVEKLHSSGIIDDRDFESYLYEIGRDDLLNNGE